MEYMNVSMCVCIVDIKTYCSRQYMLIAIAMCAVCIIISQKLNGKEIAARESNIWKLSADKEIYVYYSEYSRNRIK